MPETLEKPKTKDEIMFGLGVCEKCRGELCVSGRMVECEKCGHKVPNHPILKQLLAPQREYVAQEPLIVPEDLASSIFDRVLALEKTVKVQAKEIAELKKAKSKS